jgi:hypothetical protein
VARKTIPVPARLSWGMAPRRTALACAAASVLVFAAVLTGCVPEPGTTPGPDAAGASPSVSPTPTPSASPSATLVPIPTDCRAILSSGVLDQLGSMPLNDPALGASGVQADGSLICIWGDPAVPGTVLRTTIAYASRGPALDMLNGLLAEGYACYTPDGGTRCEKTWFSEPDLIPEGRTLFWREDVMIDSSFTNLAPSGYTAAIVGSVFG